MNYTKVCRGEDHVGPSKGCLFQGLTNNSPSQSTDITSAPKLVKTVINRGVKSQEEKIVLDSMDLFSHSTNTGVPTVSQDCARCWGCCCAEDRPIPVSSREHLPVQKEVVGV